MARVNLGRDTSGRPLVLDDTSVAKLRAAEDRLGFEFTVVQGSWRGGSGAAASAGTHDRGGVFDLRSWNIPPSIGVGKAVRVLRECGLIAWFRTPIQGFDPHIHCIDYGNPNLSPSAARQVTAWQNGRNGLANNGPDDGPRVTIPKHAPEDDMKPEEIADAPIVLQRGKDNKPWPTTVQGAFVELENSIDARADKLEAKVDALTALLQKAINAGK